MSLKNPKALFYFLLLIFFLPLIGAWYLFTYHTSWLQHTTNHGVLIKPMLSIDQLPVTDYNVENSFNTHRWLGHWVLLYVKGNNCDQRCLTTIYLMGQTRSALGKYQSKINAVYIAVQPNEWTNPSSEILRQYARTVLLKTTLPAFAHFLSNPVLLETTLQQGQVFLVDPNGFVMMRYSGTINFEEVYHDLNHLLSLGANE